MDSCGLSFEKGQRFPRTRKAWESGYCESFNGKPRDECLNGEIFYSLREAQIVIEQWRIEYNTHRPHSALAHPHQ
jgi:transposase InsO family protein